jgi:hypothetical protein
MDNVIIWHIMARKTPVEATSLQQFKIKVRKIGAHH